MDVSDPPPSYTETLPPYGTETSATSEVHVSEVLATAPSSLFSSGIDGQEKGALGV